MTSLTDEQRALLADKYVLWDRMSREGSMEQRDYNRRAADALKVALSLATDESPAQVQTSGQEAARAEGTCYGCVCRNRDLALATSALAYYGNPERYKPNYAPDGDKGKSEIEKDGGSRARGTLEGLHRHTAAAPHPGKPEA